MLFSSKNDESDGNKTFKVYSSYITRELPFETKLFHFHEKFSENQDKILNNQVGLQLPIRPPPPL